MQDKLGQENAFPIVAFSKDGVITSEECFNGMSKRFYAACSYSDSAYKWAEEMSIDACLKVLGLSSDTKWEYVIHFPKLVIRLQYMLSDELLKQENK